jgi:hypothetical protein
MKRRQIALLAVGGFAIALAAQAPASLLDRALRDASDGHLRLATTTGSIWRGGGLLVAQAPGAANGAPLATFGWRLAGIEDGALRAELEFGGRPLGHLRLGADGVAGKLADMQLPADATLALLPGALGRAEWEGQLLLRRADLRCDWRRRCDGRADIAWFGAAVRRLENGALGDYFLQLDVRGERVDAQLSSGKGPVALNGKGHFAAGGELAFDGTASGDDALLSQFPAFLGSVVTAGAQAGEYRIKVRQQLAPP